MALQSSFPLSLSQINAEFGKGMSLLAYLAAAEGVPAVRPISFSNLLGKSSVIVKTVTANANNLNLATLFTTAQWTSTTPKRVNINAGVIIASTTPATAALLTGAGMAGTLEINNAGDIRGAGGLPNSGAGGHAINVQSAGVTIKNTGAIRGGGGAGGVGGTGGQGGTGQYTAQEGPIYQRSSPTYYWKKNGTQSKVLLWAGSSVYSGGGSGDTTYSTGGITYFRGDLQSTVNVGGTIGTEYYYAIYRQYPVQVAGAGGGAGGNGGYGQGGNQARSNGLGGAGGGNNGGNSGVGGTGGTGGNGGDWGQPGTAGNTGGTGASGNISGGLGGYAGGGGGAAGYAIAGTARTLVNTGTIQGAT